MTLEVDAATVNADMPKSMTRTRWLRVCHDACRALRDDLDREQRDALRTLVERLDDCGSTLSVLVCPACDAPQPGSGALASTAHGALCGLAGCPLCDAEDRALRANVLAPAFDDVTRRAAAEIARLKRVLAPRKGVARRKPPPKFTRGDSPAARRAAAPTQLARLNDCRWFTFEVTRRYDPSAPAAPMLRRLTKVVRELHELAATLWNERVVGDRTRYDAAAFAAWLAPPSDGRVRLRGVFFAPEFICAGFESLLRDACPKARLRRLLPIESDQVEAWARALAGDPPHAPTSATFAEQWLTGRPCSVIQPELALLWSLAMNGAEVDWARSDGLMRDHYRSLKDITLSRRASAGVCHRCKGSVDFEERKQETTRYLRACAWLRHEPFAARTLPVETGTALIDEVSIEDVTPNRGESTWEKYLPPEFRENW